MIIKKLILQNFRSYYGQKVFEFQNGLNLILGANGDGKTTFYDALDFVLSIDDVERKNVSLRSCVSKKFFEELRPGQSGTVMVALHVMNDNRARLIERKFTVTKNDDESMSVSDHSHGGFMTLGGGIRKPVMLRQLLVGEALFPPIIKKYSLFKGEKALNIFEDKTTLKNLIDLFSDIKDLGPYKAYATFGDECSARAVGAAQKKDKASGEAAATLLRIRTGLESRLSQEQARLEDLRKTYSDNQSKIDAIEADLETIELVHSMQDAIKELQDIVALKRSQLDENYSTNLLDKLWILNGFQPIMEEFATKMSKLSENKQTLIRLERERVIRENAKREAEAKTIEDLKAELSELPWYIPDIKTMQSMLDKERCLVCGTKAEKGSDAYKHIAQHLQEALDHLHKKNAHTNSEEVKEEEIFHFKNVESIHQMSIQLYQYGINLCDIALDIEKEKRRNDNLYEEISDKSSLIEEKQTEMARVLAQSSSGQDIGALAGGWVNIKHWYKTKEDASIEIDRLTSGIIPDIRQKIAENIEKYKKTVVDDTAKEFLKINTFYKVFGNALENAETRTLEEFMNKLASTANRFLEMLNVDDFTGEIRIRRDFRDESIIVYLADKNGKNIDNPNTSLFTTMHLSVLFAISELTKDNLNNEYPMILDAPTSSFDEGKDKTFYQVMNEKLDKQCIIVTKSYLYKNDEDKFEVDMKGIQKLLDVKKIPIYRIQKLEGFDKKDQSTIETIVTPLF